MTIRELATTSGLTPAAISNLEANKTQARLPSLRRLAEILDVTIAYLGCYEKLPDKTLGQKIKKARLCQGFTKTEFADKIGIDERTLRHWEMDKHIPLNRFMELLRNYID